MAVLLLVFVSGVSGRSRVRPGRLRASTAPRAPRWSSALQGARADCGRGFPGPRVGRDRRRRRDPAARAVGMPRRLLGVLLAYRNSVVSTDRLVEVLWDEPPDVGGRHPAELRLPAAPVRRAGRRRRRAGQPGAGLRARGARRPASTPAASNAAWPRARPCSTRDPDAALALPRRGAGRVAGRRLRRVRRRRVDPARGDPARGAAARRDRDADRRRAPRRPSPGRGRGRARGAARRPPAARAVRRAS